MAGRWQAGTDLVREGRRRDRLVPGWSWMWVKAALCSLSTSFVSERVTSPVMATARLRAPASWSLFHKTQ